MESDEVLESGYGPATRPGDNMLNDFAHGEARGYASLAAGRGDEIATEPSVALTMTDRGSPTVFGNTAFVERPLSSEDWHTAAELLHDFYAARPGGPFLLFSAWPTPDLRDRDFGLVGHPPLMWRPQQSVPLDVVAGLEIRAVDGGDAAAAFEATLVHAYPLLELQPFSPGCLLPASALDAPGWQHWVGYLDDRPVATASAFCDDRLVHVELVSTEPDCRGRGVGRAMTAVATAHDTLASALIASDSGRSVYERLGYVAISRYTLWAGHR